MFWDSDGTVLQSACLLVTESFVLLDGFEDMKEVLVLTGQINGVFDNELVLKLHSVCDNFFLRDILFDASEDFYRE